METVEIIDNILKENIGAQHVEIEDESYRHRGHKAAGGGGHYNLAVVSPQFAEVALIDRVRMVYSALDEQINGNPKLIHALQIKTYTPAEYLSR